MTDADSISQAVARIGMGETVRILGAVLAMGVMDALEKDGLPFSIRRDGNTYTIKEA